jgi:hypothetical protein
MHAYIHTYNNSKREKFLTRVSRLSDNNIHIAKVHLELGTDVDAQVRTYMKHFASELAGQERQLSQFLVQIKAFGKSLYGIHTTVNKKSARLCFFPGQLKRKQLYVRENVGA